MKVAALALLGGCHIAFGIEHQDPLPVQVDAAGPREPIQGLVRLVEMRNDASFRPTTRSRFYTPFEMQVFVAADDGGTLAIEYHADTGTFAAPRSAGRTRIQLRFGTLIHEYQWDAPVLSLDQVATNRLDAAQAAPGTTLVGQITSTLPSQLTTVNVTGVWTRILPIFDAAGFHTPWTGPLPSSSANDQMLLAGYDLTAAGNTMLDQVATVAPIEMTSGTNTLAKLALSPAPVTGCVHAIADLAGDAARLEAAYPAIGGGPTSQSMNVFSTPLLELGPNILWLLTQAVGRANATLDYSNVFPGAKELVTAAVSRPTVFPDGLQAAVATFSFEPRGAPTCGTPITLIAHDVAIATGFSIDGRALDADHVPISLSSTTSTLAWHADGTADLFEVVIYDVTGATTLVPHVLHTRAPSVVLDRSDFVSGHRYLFSVTTTVGLSAASDGDLTQRSYPSQLADGLSPIIDVQ